MRNRQKSPKTFCWVVFQSHIVHETTSCHLSTYGTCDCTSWVMWVTSVRLGFRLACMLCIYVPRHVSTSSGKDLQLSGAAWRESVHRIPRPSWSRKNFGCNVAGTCDMWVLWTVKVWVFAYEAWVCYYCLWLPAFAVQILNYRVHMIMIMPLPVVISDEIPVTSGYWYCFCWPLFAAQR